MRCATRPANNTLAAKLPGPSQTRRIPATLTRRTLRIWVRGMKKPIRLFYSRRRNGNLNFGDDIAPLLVEVLSGRRVTHARVSGCDLAAMGSIIEMLIERRHRRWRHGRLGPLSVWGAGCLRKGMDLSARGLDLHALRGPMTAARLGWAGPLGDPGLLLGRLLKPGPKTHKWGVVAHYTDLDSPRLAQLLDGTERVKNISVEAPPLEVLAQIAACDHIAASSLHGLVAADALGIPNWRIELAGQLDGGDYKFRDYCGGIDRDSAQAMAVSGLQNLDQLLAAGYPDFSYMAALPAVADRLDASLREQL